MLAASQYRFPNYQETSQGDSRGNASLSDQGYLGSDWAYSDWASNWYDDSWSYDISYINGTYSQTGTYTPNGGGTGQYAEEFDGYWTTWEGWWGYGWGDCSSGDIVPGTPYLIHSRGVGNCVWCPRNSLWRWEKVQRVSLRSEGRELHLAIPRKALGLPTGTNALAVDFKWADNLQHPGDVMDFYSSGDVAPEGRFKFRYVAD